MSNRRRALLGGSIKAEDLYKVSYAYYPFNGNINDYSGNGRNLSNPVGSISIYSDCVQSSGGRLVASYGMNNAISSTVSFTIFVPSSLYVSNDMYIFSAMLNSGSAWPYVRYSFGIPRYMGNYYFFGSQAGPIDNYTNGYNWDSNRTGGLNSCYNLPSIILNAKNNITIVRDVTNLKFKIYVNGVLDFQANMRGNYGGESTEYRFTLLDEDSTRGRGYHFNNKLYNFVYWDYVLDEKEIKIVSDDLYNN